MACNPQISIWITYRQLDGSWQECGVFGGVAQGTRLGCTHHTTQIPPFHVWKNNASQITMAVPWLANVTCFIQLESKARYIQPLLSLFWGGEHCEHVVGTPSGQVSTAGKWNCFNLN